ncbi:hypothetical protein D3C74_151450 [compost metagenome]
MNPYERVIKNETPEQREKALREALEEIWIQNKGFVKHSAAGRVSIKALNILKKVYGDDGYESIS